MTNLLGQLLAGLDEATRERLRCASRADVDADALAAARARLVEDLRARGHDGLLLALVVASLARQLRAGLGTSFRAVVADLLGGDAEAVEAALLDLARDEAAAGLPTLHTLSTSQE